MCRATHPTTLTAERTGGSASTRALEHLLAICSPAVLRAHSRCSIDRSSCPIVCVRQWCNSCLPSVVTVLYCTARFGSLALLAVDSCRGAPRPCAWCAGGCGPSRKVQMISFLQKLPWTWLPNLNEVRTCPAALCSSVCSSRPSVARRTDFPRSRKGASPIGCTATLCWSNQVSCDYTSSTRNQRAARTQPETTWPPSVSPLPPPQTTTRPGLMALQ